MLDLDDFAQLQPPDRHQLFVRAGQPEARWPAAQQIVTLLAQTTALTSLRQLDEGLTIFLLLPPEFMGIGQALASLSTQLAGISLLLWPLAQALPDGARQGLVVTAIPQATLPLATKPRRTMKIVDLSPHINVEQHPAQVFLVLWLLLKQLAQANGMAILPVAAPNLGDCAPTIPLAHNPAKQLALQLHERLPFFYGSQQLAGIAADWRLRMLWYAETMSTAASLHELARLQVMARLPRYWFNVVTFVRLTASLPVATEEAKLQSKLDRLFALRRLQTHQVEAPASLPALGALWHLLEFGEWLALYAAALYNVDPADRVPLQFLED